MDPLEMNVEDAPSAIEQFIFSWYFISLVSIIYLAKRCHFHYRLVNPINRNDLYDDDDYMTLRQGDNELREVTFAELTAKDSKGNPKNFVALDGYLYDVGMNFGSGEKQPQEHIGKDITFGVIHGFTAENLAKKFYQNTEVTEEERKKIDQMRRGFDMQFPRFGRIREYYISQKTKTRTSKKND